MNVHARCPPTPIDPCPLCALLIVFPALTSMSGPCPPDTPNRVCSPQSPIPCPRGHEADTNRTPGGHACSACVFTCQRPTPDPGPRPRTPTPKRRAPHLGPRGRGVLLPHYCLSRPHRAHQRVANRNGGLRNSRRDNAQRIFRTISIGGEIHTAPVRTSASLPSGPSLRSAGERIGRGALRGPGSGRCDSMRTPRHAHVMSTSTRPCP